MLARMFKAFSRILRFTRELWPLYVLVMISSVATALLALATPFLVGRATDVIVETLRNDSSFYP